MVVRFLVVLFFFAQTLLFSQDLEKVDSLISLIGSSSPEKIEETEELIIMWMYTSSHDSAKALSDHLLKRSPGLNDNSLYIKTLIHSYRFYGFREKISLLGRAEKLAKTEKNYRLLAAAYTFKAISYRDHSMTDSAMTFALMAKDLAEEKKLIRETPGILQLIADMHYYSGQYDEAEKTYQQMLQENIRLGKERDNLTIINNLGLIRVKQKRYSEAEAYFLRSLGLLTSEKMHYADSAGLTYIFRKLLETSVAQQKFPEAERWFRLAEYCGIKFRQQAELPGIYAARGEIFLQQEVYDSALSYFRKAELLDRKSPDISFQVSIFGGLANTYLALNDRKNASDYLLLLLDAKNKADSAFHRARYMNIFAEHNYKNYQKEIDNYQSRQILLIVIISFVSLSLLVGIFFYIRLNALNRKLVQKNIEAVEGYGSHHALFVDAKDEEAEKDSEETQADNFSDGSDQEEIPAADFDENKIRGLVNRLVSLMEDEKLYLNPEFSLGDAAQRLETNRTYLSRAVNAVYGVNFSSYLNDLRVKEAIRHITSGEMSHLNMEGLARQCGFSNRVTLTRAFQKFTGVSPSFFIKNAGVSL